MGDPSEVMARAPPIAVGTRRVEHLDFGWLLHRDRVRVLKDLGPRGLNTHGVRDRQLIEERGYRLQQRRGKELFIFRSQRRHKPNIHATPTLSPLAMTPPTVMQRLTILQSAFPACRTTIAHFIGIFLGTSRIGPI